jgi:XTP/dITP diphosphohydrolase
MRLRLASANAHKLDELRRVLPGWELDVLPLDYPPEDGATYEENARIKARHARAHAPADEWVVADDSGVEAVALGGRPGIHSARWSGAWVETMLAELQGSEDRGGRYVCLLVAISPHGEEVVARGESRTVAELGNEWKAEHSHRARAARTLAGELAKRT